jgi:hypothetical protein
MDIRQHSKVLLIVNFYDKYTKGPIIRQPRRYAKTTKEKPETLVAFPNLPKITPEILDRICGIFLLTGKEKQTVTRYCVYITVFTTKSCVFLA